MYDLSDLTGDTTPVSLATLIAANQDCPLSPEDITTLEGLTVGQSTYVATVLIVRVA